MPTRPLVANGIAATSAAPTTATIAPIRTLPAGARVRPKTMKQPTSATPDRDRGRHRVAGQLDRDAADHEQRRDPGRRRDRGEWRGRPAIAMIAEPSSSEATTISAPASRAESIAEA